jgi:hypothetical protein
MLVEKQIIQLRKGMTDTQLCVIPTNTNHPTHHLCLVNIPDSINYPNHLYFKCTTWKNYSILLDINQTYSLTLMPNGTNLKLKKDKNYIVIKLLLLFCPLCIFYFTTTTLVSLCFSTVRPFRESTRRTA